MFAMSLRMPDELAERMRVAAEAEGLSLNAYVVRLVEASTNPDNAASEVERMRERLRRGGVLATVAPRPIERPSPGEVEAAGRELAAGGLLVSDLVTQDREEREVAILGDHDPQ